MKSIMGILGGILVAISLTPVKTMMINPTAPAIIRVDSRGLAIDAYFHRKHMPLEGKGLGMVLAADQNGLDWRLLPAISVRESSGGREACGANPFGWNSCLSTFATVDEAIATVAANLGGNVTSTRAYYAGKSTIDKIHSYNPDSIVAGYGASVLEIMNEISPSAAI